MTKDLYRILGVRKDATPDEIKRQFRKRAKETHPDKGGSRELFALVVLANDTLSDANRRKKYDDTGMADEDNHPEQQSKFVSVIAEAIDHVFLAMASMNMDERYIDIVGDLKKEIGIRRKDAASKIETINKLILQSRSLSKKFSVTDPTKPNYIETIIAGRISQLCCQKENFEMAITAFDEALDALSYQKYDMETMTREALCREASRMFATMSQMGV